MQTFLILSLATLSLIVSASRKKDIFAHHGYWLMERLRRGYLKVNFPATRYIAFHRTRLIVFWTKNPQPLMRYLDEIDDMGLNYYFQFTLNDYEQEGLEPNVLPLVEGIDRFKRVADRIGREKVIWRFDPLVLTDTVDLDRLIGKVDTRIQALAGFAEKMVFRFLHPAAHKKAERKQVKVKISPGRPALTKSVYKNKWKFTHSIQWALNEKALADASRTDGIFPLVTDTDLVAGDFLRIGS